MTRRYYEIGRLVEVPRDVLVRHDGVIGLPVDWVIQTAEEIRDGAVQASDIGTPDEEETPDTDAESDDQWYVSGADLLTYKGHTLRIVGQERKLLLHLLEGESPIETVSAVVWGSSEPEIDTIKVTARRVNAKLKAAGIGLRVSVTSGAVCLRTPAECP